MKKTLSLLVITLATMHAFAETELKGTPAELAQYLASVPQPVSLTGGSELKVAADRAIISLKVVTESKSLQDALHSNQELRARILSTLKERGFSTNSVKPSKFSSTPQYGVFKEKAKSYRVENVVKVTAQDEKEFQAVANLVDVLPEVRYESIEFEHSDKDALKAKALAQTIEKVTEKKRLYEEKIGVTLTPRRFTESGVSMGSSESTRARYAVSKGLAYSSALSTPLPTAADVDGEMPTSFGELVFTAQVTVEYSLTAK
jgi:uncharacterized protein